METKLKTATGRTKLSDFPEYLQQKQKHDEISREIQQANGRVKELERQFNELRHAGGLDGAVSRHKVEGELLDLGGKIKDLRATEREAVEELTWMKEKITSEVCADLADEHRALVRKIAQSLVLFATSVRELEVLQQNLRDGGIDSFQHRLTIPFSITGSPFPMVSCIPNWIKACVEEGVLKASEVPQEIR